jgi:hypothetical protein
MKPRLERTHGRRAIPWNGSGAAYAIAERRRLQISRSTGRRRCFSLRGDLNEARIGAESVAMLMFDSPFNASTQKAVRLRSISASPRGHAVRNHVVASKKF